MENQEALLVIIIFVILPVAVLLGFVFGVYYKKKLKRKKIQTSLPPEVSFVADIRISSQEYQRKTFKFLAYESSGLLYILNGIVYIKGYKKRDIEFNLRTVRIEWEGAMAESGLFIQWLSIGNTYGEYYINSDNGILAIELGAKKATYELFEQLKDKQQIINQSPPPAPLQ